MYSKEILSLLKKKGIGIGDEVKLDSPKGVFTGLLMPRPEGAEDTFVIKLGNGYNLGIDAKGAEISLVKKSQVPKPHGEEPKDRGEVAIIGCGGTIASKVEYRTGAVYPAISPREMRNAFPDVDSIATIHTRQLFELFSDDMNSSHWAILAKAIAEEVKNGAKGVVVMHGTDTMSYTAAAISFMLQDLPAPVVITGAQRSSDRPSSDNRLNLLNSVFAAKQDLGEVAVCMHAGPSDDICHLHRGTKVRKMHSSRRDAFRSINSPPIASLDYRASRFEPLTAYKKRSAPGSLKLAAKMSDNVALIQVHPDIKPKFISSLGSYDGVVLMATGLGHVPTNPTNEKHATPIFPAVRELVESGVPVVLAPQTIYGRLNLKVYTNGRLLLGAGVIGDGMDWTPECAYVKLCWVLGQTKDMKKVKQLMETDMAGEFGSRSPLEVD
jgi:glutamyl-tRNA(Gln) amidotransferase subunit D